MPDEDRTTFDPADGDPPSAEFVESLLGRLETAWHSQEDGHTTGPSAELIDLTVRHDKDDPMSSNFQSGEDDRNPLWRRTPFIAAAAAVIIAIAIAGLVVARGGDGKDPVVTVEDPEPTTVPEPTAQPEATAVPEATAPPEATAVPTAEPSATPSAGSEWDFEITYIEVEATSSVAANDEFAWVASGGAEPVLSTIDLATNMVVSTTPIRPGARNANYGFGSVWITHDDGTVSRFDPDTETVVATITVGDGRLGWLEPGLESVWVANDRGMAAVSIDPTTNTVAATIAVPSDAGAVKEEPDGVWVRGRDGVVYRIDPEAGSVVAVIDTGSGGSAFMTSPDAVWAPGTSELYRIDFATNEIGATVDLIDAIGRPLVLGGIHYGGGSIWVRYHHGQGTGIARIDPATNEVVAYRELRAGWTATGGMNTGPTTAWTYNPTAIARIDFD